jgi:rhodanese-related sulfurtransferase
VNLNISKILSIILISVFISLIYNHFNPNGLSFFREARKMNWESDSLTSINSSNFSIADTNVLNTNISDSKIINNNNDNIESFEEPKAIKLDFAYKLFNDGIKFIDSRSAEEFAEGHVKGAVNIPFYGSENYLDTINRLNKNEIVITYCSSADCDISILSGDELFEMGFKRVYVFIGGYDEWIKNNYPTSKK